MKKIACMANGLFIATGPTGSGKTTTLYSLLSSINHLQKKIITVEDPVEYTLEGLTQVSIDPNIGLDFPKCLRSLLRQDPNVIMIGEIRDTSTAQIAIHAALTGHLVLSSLHTQDSIGAIYRMQHLGIEKNLINETIEGILAQRLVRCLCPECKKIYTPPKNILEALSIQDTQELFTQNGCHHCAYSGFFGRMGLFELFIMHDSIRDLIYHDASPSLIKKEAETKGLVSLQTIAKKTIASGKTSLEEIMNYIELHNT